MSEQVYTHYRSKLLHHLPEINALRNGKKILPPVNVEIDLCNRCSLGCESCHFAYTHSRGPYAAKGARAHYANTGDLMKENVAANILYQLAEAQVKSVTWTGGGEPTLHPLIKHITTLGHSCALDQGMYTNGCHVDLDLAAVLGRTLKWVYVSLDCVNRATYQKEKKVDGFERACDGAKRLAKKVDVVGIGFLIHAGNVQQMPAMVKLAEKLKATYVQFRPTIDFDFDAPGVAKGDRSWAAEAAVAVLPDSKIRIEYDRQRFADYANWEGHGYHKCLWSGLQAVITPDGRMWTCVNKRGLENDCLGDLTKDTFMNVWSRRSLAPVNEDCRLMCRGHLPNKFLHQISSNRPHVNFI